MNNKRKKIDKSKKNIETEKKRTFITVTAYIKNIEKSQINDIMLRIDETKIWFFEKINQVD
jgi:hypothetical protein